MNMESAWNVGAICKNMHGVCAEQAWNMYVTGMETVWHIDGICMGQTNMRYTQNMQRIDTGCAWKIHGKLVQDSSGRLPTNG